MDFLVAVAAKWIIGLLWILSACVWSLQSPGFIISGAWIFLDLDSLLLDWRCSFLLARIGSPVFGIVARRNFMWATDVVSLVFNPQGLVELGSS